MHCSFNKVHHDKKTPTAPLPPLQKFRNYYYDGLKTQEVVQILRLRYQQQLVPGESSRSKRWKGV